MARFDYILDRIKEEPFVEIPFRHIHIHELFNQDDFAELLAASDIAIREVASDEELFQQLFDAGYKIVEFPGCITDRRAYLYWRSSRQALYPVHSTCEAFGMALRLIKPRSDICAELNRFLCGAELSRVLAEKFDIDVSKCDADGGIQKYLDGYEISPHADVRRKALTFMANINPHRNSEELSHHTHYLRFKDRYKYVQTLWEFNTHVERCWVPWTWCETQTIQRKNNTMVVFAPSDRTMHGVKAKYDHLRGQRTQLYGNLWYRQYSPLRRIEWEELDISNTSKQSPISLRRRLLASMPSRAKRIIRAMGSMRSSEMAKRNY